MTARHPLQDIKDFHQLVDYLRDELDWPIDSESFDDLTFDYEADELGLDAQNAAKVRHIKQLRPLVSGQPWGIFFVEFEPKRLPVVALRKLLANLVVKKRSSGKRSDSAAWQLHDLLFVSAFGEGNDRQISLAHFSEGARPHDLPTLKVLGWDELDTQLNLQYVDKTLHLRLRWPADTANLQAWRQEWSSAFTLRNRHVINTAQELAVRLADLAKAIREKVKAVLKIETERGPLRKLYAAFQQALIHDLKEDDFADMYAQTITYGLFSAAVSRTTPDAGTIVLADNLVDMVPITNPFLREMLSTFLSVGGRKGKLDFDELGVQDVIETLNSDDTNLGAVIRNFGDLRQGEDPVIHFYEDFLKQYDKKRKVERGVFYTPRPVVSYIVRSVHELLQTEFGLEDGLASTVTWGEMVARNPDLKLPATKVYDEAVQDYVDRPIDAATPFVQILDPATGTATFLVEVIDMIYESMKTKWKRAGLSAERIRSAWNDYVPKHLLPRVYGYELMMAPYAIAHMKIGLKLTETGYGFKSDERARVYLTNALDRWTRTVPLIGFDALAAEAISVNVVKRDVRFTVIIGNPPYSNLSANLTDEARALIEKYKFIDGARVIERNALQLERNLNDDYVKFIAFAEDVVTSTTLGLVSLISNNVYCWSPSLRGMRSHLQRTFPRVRILDLHGASQRGPADDRFLDDENVFDIEQPVAICAFSMPAFGVGKGEVAYDDVVGPRATKYEFLSRHTVNDFKVEFIKSSSSLRRFSASSSEYVTEYSHYLALSSICPTFAEGVKTGRDWLVTDFEQQPIVDRMKGIRDSKETDEILCNRIGLSKKKAWNLTRARDAIANANLEAFVQKIAYRPFDQRWIFYHNNWVSSASIPVMQHLIASKGTQSVSRPANLALLAGRISRDHNSRLYWCTRELTDKCILSSLDNVSVFPALLIRPEKSGTLALGVSREVPNLSTEFMNEIQRRFYCSRSDNKCQLNVDGTLEVFHYLYSILWSPIYRKRYSSELNNDFPRIPLAGSEDLYKALSTIGASLVETHLLESAVHQIRSTSYVGPDKPEINSVSWSDNTVWIDAPAARRGQAAGSGTIGFRGVREDVWKFHIGGYQVCEKWLKDRKGRTLSKDDIEHYQKIVVAISETFRLMAEIDQVIDKHGGWPGAFCTEPLPDSATAAPPVPSAPAAAGDNDAEPFQLERQRDRPPQQRLPFA